MKKFVRLVAVLVSTAVAGILVWRKVESDQLRNDLWNEAENAFAQQNAAQPTEQAQPVAVKRG